jgi:hypothetical protein
VGGDGAYRYSLNDIIPILGKRYLIKTGSRHPIALHRITRELPKELQPNGQARIISLKSVESPLFLNEAIRRNGTRGMGIVTILRIEASTKKGDEPKAVVRVRPPAHPDPNATFGTSRPKSFEGRCVWKVTGAPIRAYSKTRPEQANAPASFRVLNGGVELLCQNQKPLAVS